MKEIPVHNKMIPTTVLAWKSLHEDARLPVYGTSEAAGADLCSVMDAVIEPGDHVLIRTGMALEMMPGYEAQVRPRSGLALKHGVTVLNSPGTIDSDYRGEIGVILINHGREAFKVAKGDRIAQLVVAQIVRANFYAAGGVLSDTARGAGGFGSTGVSSSDLKIAENA